MSYPELSIDERKRRLIEINEQQKRLDEERRFYEDIANEETCVQIKEFQRTFVGKCFKGYCGDICRDIKGQEEWLLIFDINGEEFSGMAQCVSVSETAVSLVGRNFLMPRPRMMGIPNKDYYNSSKWIIHDSYKEIFVHDFLEKYHEVSNKFHNVIASVNQCCDAGGENE